MADASGPTLPGAASSPAPPSAAPSSPGTPTSGWTPPPPSPPSRSSWWVVVAAVVVATGLILGTLYAVGVFTPSSHPTGPMTYSTAAGEVTSYLAGYHGGGWKIVGAAGIAPPSARNLILNQTPLPGAIRSCLTSWLFANHTSVAVTSYSGSPASGKGTIWTFLTANSTSLLVVVNNAGSVQPYFAATCTSSLALLPALPSNVIDSSAAAESAWNAGMDGFVAAHPGGASMYAVLPDLSFLGTPRPSAWAVLYEACDPLTTSGSTLVPAYNATVSALSGRVTSQNTTMIPCGTLSNLTIPGLRLPSPVTALGTVFAFGPTAEKQAGATFFYNLSVAAAVSPLQWQDIQLYVESPQGVRENVTFASIDWAVVGITGQRLAGVNGTSSETAWAFGGATPVTSAQVLSLATSVDLAGAGDLLVAEGVGAYSGNVVTVIP